MEYTEAFKELVKNSIENNQYVGLGYPNSKILIVGKETSNDVANKAKKVGKDLLFQEECLQDIKENASKWNINIHNNIDADAIPIWTGGKDSPLDSNPLFPFKSLPIIALKEGQTWRKYQKLHDLIFIRDNSISKEKTINFLSNFFLTEMSDIPAKNTSEARRHINFKSNLEYRKNSFFTSTFIQQFPVVVLACSDYIQNKDDIREIDDIFNVTFKPENQFNNELFSNGNWFYIHYNCDETKLVIHTRQLSGNVDRALLEEMGLLINKHLSKLGIL
jgi:hypothetical protein